MTKKYTIKDIAQLAGVSAGTVDRVIHDRGEVSPEARKKVEDVFEQINYIPRTHSKTQESSRKVRILVILPQYQEDEYWDHINKGIERAHTHFSSYNLDISYLYYDQFDAIVCRKIYQQALTMRKDAVILGPSFDSETVEFTRHLDDDHIPYVFVDTGIDDTHPLCIYSPHNFQSGFVLARLLTAILDKDKDVVLFQAKRTGDKMSVCTAERQKGLVAHLDAASPETKIYQAQYDKGDSDENTRLMDEFFAAHANIGGAVVFNSKAYLLAEYFKKRNIRHVKLVGFGVNAPNTQFLKEGLISFLIEERPKYQGYMAVKSLIEFLFFGIRPHILNYTPIDIIIKETVDFYRTPSLAFVF
ncbi:MAG: LacI family transcriptional regulator [Prevotella sp.]|nr:LacI family transcriptional regulator [Prevotella sp.]